MKGQLKNKYSVKHKSPKYALYSKIVLAVFVLIMVYSLTTLSQAMKGKGPFSVSLGTQPSINKVAVADKESQRALIQSKLAELQKRKGQGGRGGSQTSSAGFVPAQPGQTTCAGGANGVAPGSWANDGNGTCFLCTIKEQGTVNANGVYSSSRACADVRSSGDPVVATPDEIEAGDPGNCYDARNGNAIVAIRGYLSDGRQCLVDKNTGKARPVEVPQPGTPGYTLPEGVMTQLVALGLTTQELSEITTCIQSKTDTAGCLTNTLDVANDIITNRPQGTSNPVDPNPNKYSKPTPTRVPIIESKPRDDKATNPPNPAGTRGVVGKTSAPKSTYPGQVIVDNSAIGQVYSNAALVTGGTIYAASNIGQAAVNITYKAVTAPAQVGSYLAENVSAPVIKATGNAVGSTFQVIGTVTGNTDIYDMGTASKVIGTTASNLTAAGANAASTIINVPLTVYNNTVDKVQSSVAAATSSVANTIQNGFDAITSLGASILNGFTPPRPTSTPKPTTKATTKPQGTVKATSKPRSTPTPTKKPTPKPTGVDRYTTM